MSEYLINPFTDKTIWVHSTNANDPQDWIKIAPPSGKYKEHDKFYIGAGENLLSFGNNTVFVRYKPTKIFNPNNLFVYGTKESQQQFLDCVYNELLKLDDESKRKFLWRFFNDYEEDCVEDDSESEWDWWEDSSIDEPVETIKVEDSLGFGPCDKFDIEWAIKTKLKTLSYIFYEYPFIQHCLVSLGYTAYFEIEKNYDDYAHLEDFDLDPTDINVAIFESDFNNIEIVGVLNAITIDGVPHYQCPKCKVVEELDQSMFEKPLAADMVLNIMESGKFECRKCSEG